MKNISAKYSSLINKKVVITGGASGIGSVMAKYFYEQGSKVIILDVKDNEANDLIKTMDEENNLSPPSFFHCDLTKTKSIENVFSEIYNNFGYLDVLCNNAADDDRHNWDGYWVDNKEYRLTIDDGLKLQGFNDYDFVGKNNEKWKMLGNTIPTIFTEIIGKQIINHTSLNSNV